MVSHSPGRITGLLKIKKHCAAAQGFQCLMQLLRYFAWVMALEGDPVVDDQQGTGWQTARKISKSGIIGRKMAGHPSNIL